MEQNLSTNEFSDSQELKELKELIHGLHEKFDNLDRLELIEYFKAKLTAKGIPLEYAKGIVIESKDQIDKTVTEIETIFKKQ